MIEKGRPRDIDAGRKTKQNLMKTLVFAISSVAVLAAAHVMSPGLAQACGMPPQCRVCEGGTHSQACGNTCIDSCLECTQEPGCAVNKAPPYCLEEGEDLPVVGEIPECPRIQVVPTLEACVVEIVGWETFGGPGDEICACGLQPEIGGFDVTGLFTQGPGSDDLGEFSPNALASDALDLSVFSSYVADPFDGGEAIDFVAVLSATPGECDQVADAIRADGISLIAGELVENPGGGFEAGDHMSEVLYRDSDGDGYVDRCDLCPWVWNDSQLDADHDGVGDACDWCPGVDDTIDADGDGLADGCDLCPATAGSPNNGGCLDGGIGPCSLVINELMPNPAVISDANGEWIEILNNTNDTRYLLGVTIADATGSFVIQDDIILGPWEAAVLAAKRESISGLPVVDGIYPEIGLVNSGETLSIFYDGALVSSMTYGASQVVSGNSITLLDCPLCDPVDPVVEGHVVGLELSYDMSGDNFGSPGETACMP